MWQQIIQHDGSLLLKFTLVATALLLARLIPLTPRLNPLYWFSVLANLMANKVCHAERQANQQRVAGILASLFLIVPFGFTLLFLFELAAYPVFFELALLYCCMWDLHSRTDLVSINRQLLLDDKPAARAGLAHWTTRDTDVLSATGLSKTGIELNVTSPAYASVAVVVFFWLGGAPLVLFASLLKTLEANWPAVDPKYHKFSAWLARLNFYLFWLPTQAHRLTLAIQGGPHALATLVASPSSRMVERLDTQMCHLAGTILSVELGGARKYAGIRVATVKVGGKRLPNSSDLRASIKLVDTCHYLWLGFSVLIPTVWIFLRVA